MARYVHGLENVLARIHREMMAVRGRTYKGMFTAMKFLENEMDTVSPTVPEDTKEMRNSWFITGNPDPINPSVWGGYTDPKAPIVHELENINQGPVNWTKPGSGQKWLQIHYDRNRNEMLMIVAQHARVPGSQVVGTPAASFVNIGSRTTERNVEF